MTQTLDYEQYSAEGLNTLQVEPATRVDPEPLPGDDSGNPTRDEGQGPWDGFGLQTMPEKAPGSLKNEPADERERRHFSEACRKSMGRWLKEINE